MSCWDPPIKGHWPLWVGTSTVRNNSLQFGSTCALLTCSVLSMDLRGEITLITWSVESHSIVEKSSQISSRQNKVLKVFFVKLWTDLTQRVPYSPQMLDRVSDGKTTHIKLTAIKLCHWTWVIQWIILLTSIFQVNWLTCNSLFWDLKVLPNALMVSLAAISICFDLVVMKCQMIHITTTSVLFKKNKLR